MTTQRIDLEKLKEVANLCVSHGLNMSLGAEKFLALVAVVGAALACRDSWVTEAKAAGYALNLETAAGMLCDYETKLVLACQPFTASQGSHINGEQP